MIPVPEKAFLLAAGMGTRLRPHTDTLPKPMVPVAGRPILDYTLDKLVAIGVKEVWINLHHLPEVIKGHLAARNDVKIHFSEEETLLDTGGGVKKCLKSFKNEPFYLINGDAMWKNGKSDALLALADQFDGDTTDILLLLQPINSMLATQGVGDYDVVHTQAVRNINKQGRYMFTGIRIVHPRTFVNYQENMDKFSFLTLMDAAQNKGRLKYVIHDGEWYHISTPADLAAVDLIYRGQA